MRAGTDDKRDQLSRQNTVSRACRTLRTIIGGAVDPKVLSRIPVLESPASGSGSDWNQQLTPKSLIILRVQVHLYNRMYTNDLLGNGTAAVSGHNVRQQKVCHPLVGVDLILHARKAVAFILVDLGFHGASTFLDSLHDLLRL